VTSLEVEVVPALAQPLQPKFMNKELAPIISYIVTNLVDGNYQQLIDESQDKRLEAADVKAVIEEHGVLMLPPSDSKPRMYCASLKGRNETLVDCFLWIDDAISDLMVRIVAYKPLSEGKFSLWDIYAA
jgi:hypothetical protein